MRAEDKQGAAGAEQADRDVDFYTLPDDSSWLASKTARTSEAVLAVDSEMLSLRCRDARKEHRGERGHPAGRPRCMDGLPTSTLIV